MASFADPTGEFVFVSQALVDHMLQLPGERWDGREAYFPFIPELIETPYEIWVNFAKNEESGRVAVRKKYVKTITLEKDQILGLYAESEDGLWVAGGFFRGGATGAGNLRKGKLLYGRE
jgi:hypothetical protein